MTNNLGEALSGAVGGHKPLPVSVGDRIERLRVQLCTNTGVRHDDRFIGEVLDLLSEVNATASIALAAPNAGENVYRKPIGVHSYGSTIDDGTYRQGRALIVVCDDGAVFEWSAKRLQWGQVPAVPGTKEEAAMEAAKETE